MLPLVDLNRGLWSSKFIEYTFNLRIFKALSRKTPWIPVNLNTFLSISIIMLAAFPTNVLEKPVIKLMKIGSGLKTRDKI